MSPSAAIRSTEWFRAGGSRPWRESRCGFRPRRTLSRANLALKWWWWCTARFLRLPLLAWAVAKHDTFVFGFASSFFAYLELPLLKLLRKRVVYIFPGSDSRPPYLNGAVARPEDARVNPDALVRTTRRTKPRVRTIERWADVVVANPLSAQLHERPIVSYLAAREPRVASRSTPRGIGSRSRGARSVATRSEGVRRDPVDGRASSSARAPTRLVELSGVPRARPGSAAGRRLVVDRSTPTSRSSGFAGEAAGAGRQVVVGGYGRDEIEEHCAVGRFRLSCSVVPRISRASSSASRPRRAHRELGESACTFVEDELRSRDVAQRLLDAIDGRRPEWTFDQQRITYVHGRPHRIRGTRARTGDGRPRGRVCALRGDKPRSRRDCSSSPTAMRTLRVMIARSRSAPGSSKPK